MMRSDPELSPTALYNKATNQAQVIDPQKIAEEAAKERDKASEPPATPPASQEARPTFFEAEKPNEQSSETPKEAAATVDTDTDEETPTAEGVTIEDNYKRLRSTYKETKANFKKVQSELAEAQEKLKIYVAPQVLEEKDQKIEYLSQFEKLHNLKGSQEYQEKYIAPLTEKQEKLKEIFKDYGVPEGELDNAVKRATTLNGTRALDHFLSDHFDTEFGARDAKHLIQEIKGLESQAKDAEKEPARALESLQAQSKEINERRERERRTRVVTTATDTWVETLAEVRSEGQITELIPREGDHEFNANFPNKIVAQAASEYGKLITEMAKDGATPSKPVAKALARMVLLSQAAGVAIVTRDRALEAVEQVERNAQRTNGLYRPNIGGGNSTRAPADGTQKKETTLQDDVRSLVNSVLQKR